MDMNEYGKKLAEIEKKTEAALGPGNKRLVNYSAYKTDEGSLPIDNLNERALREMYEAQGASCFRRRRRALRRMLAIGVLDTGSDR